METKTSIDYQKPNLILQSEVEENRQEKIEEIKPKKEKPLSLKRLILQKYPNFFNDLDPNFKLFAREIRKELRNQGHVITAITGYPNSGKSNNAAILGMLIDDDYDFDKNICFIPSAKEIEHSYMSLNMYSYLHIDEASRSLHKHKWYEKVQQKLNELYDTERENHFLCTALLMPRFQNFTENFRNFMIKYWVNLPVQGLAVFYKRDEDKDCKDPWHIDESYKKKRSKWGRKRVFERGLPEQIRAEQLTDCYWFYCRIPAIPEDIWEIYQKLKKESREKSKEGMAIELEDHRGKIKRERQERINCIKKMQEEGKSIPEIALGMGFSLETIRKYLREIKAFESVTKTPSISSIENQSIISNQYRKNKSNGIKEIKAEFDKI